MAKRKNTEQEPVIEIVSTNSGSGSPSFFEKNQNIIFGVLGVILLGVLLYFGYRNLILEPKNKEAMSQSFQAQIQFERDSFNLALNNPGGGYPGFLEIINKYSGTKAANTAKYYAGISYLNMGNFEEAVKYLNDFKATGDILPITKLGTLADAYAELNQMDNARSNYEKAVKYDNSYLTPYYLKKLAFLYEIEGNKEKALEAYNKIKHSYPKSQDALDVDKYIARLQ